MSGGHYNIDLYDSVKVSYISELELIKEDFLKYKLDPNKFVQNRIDSLISNLRKSHSEFLQLFEVIRAMDYYHCGDYVLDQVIEAVAEFEKLNEPTKRN